MCLVGCSATGVYIYLSHSRNLNQFQRMYMEMNDTLNIPFYEAKINLAVSKIWSISNASYTTMSYEA
jgi:hypothetical protein